MNKTNPGRIGIINHSTGNVGSVRSALRFYNYDTVVIERAGDLKNTDLLVMAGVGNFPTAVKKLKKQKLWDAIDKAVTVKKKPVIGICLGMQLFADLSNEDGVNAGFGWIKGKVVRLDGDKLRVPHIGWNQVKYGKNHELFRRIRYGFFYFMHSYHFIPDDKKVIVATTDCGGRDIISAVRKNNIVGVQFHPEKSQGDGLRFLRNTIESLI
jgi:imidazole glycerol-phosphate synthase subunit HisH